MANDVTRKDLADLEARLEGKLDAVEQRIYERLERVAERIETKLLTAFHRYAEEQHTRLQRVERAEASDAERLAKLEDRVRAIEERLDFPGRPQIHGGTP